MDSRIQILIADDHALLRETMALALNAQPDMVVVAGTGSNKETMRIASETQPNLILLDITMPDGSAIGIVPELCQRCPEARILIVTMHDDPAYLRAALAAGAHGYFVKRAPISALLEAIRVVCRGERFVDESLREHAAHIVEAAKPPIARLSEREHQVLLGLAQGLQYQAIAEKMRISVKTVETYRSRLTAKLGFTNRADLMRFAIESGILNNVPHQ
jgi:two-component system response regulator NreC